MVYIIVVLTLVIIGMVEKNSVNKTSKIPKNLKQEIKFVADTSGYENLQKKINNTYDNIIMQIKNKAKNGYYRYSYDNFANTHETEMILDGVCDKLCTDGFSAEHHNYGYSWREIVVTWKL